MKVNIVKNTMSTSLKKIQRNLGTLPKELYEYWRSITPIKTGRARRSTRLQGTTINADYPYAKPLDDGSSQQAPEGMSKPTEQYLQKLLKRKVRK